MRQAHFLSFTAVTEAGTGLLLLVLPSVPLALLLGVEQASPEAFVIARVAGAALLAIGVACWMARNDNRTSALLGLIIGVLIYDLAAAGILTYAGLVLSSVGIALWPAVVLHSALAVWCTVCLFVRPNAVS